MAAERAANYYSMIILRRASLFLLFLCASLAPLSAQRNRIPARIDNSRTVVLRGRVHPKARAANDSGPVENSFQRTTINGSLRSSTRTALGLARAT